MTYGPEFFNVYRPDPESGLVAIPDRPALNNVQVLPLLHAAIRHLTGLGVPGVLYLPPGRYLVAPTSFNTNDDNGVLRIPPNVTVKFAPGAILVPRPVSGATPDPNNSGDRASIIIEGSIDAGLQQIFMLQAPGTVPVPTDNPPDFSPTPTGLVRIDSLHVPVIRPEWWGAGLVPLIHQEGVNATPPQSYAPLNRAALQAALDSAWRYRVWRGLSPIPVEVTGPLIVSGQVTVQEPSLPPDTPPPGPLVIRGTQAFGNVNAMLPSLIATGRGNFEGVSLLHLEGNFDFLLENLHFDGFNIYASRTSRRVLGAPQCVSLDRPANTSDHVRGTFRKCGFSRASHRLVQLGVAFPKPGARHNLGNVAFEGCAFGQANQEDITLLPPLNEIPDGVVFRASETACLHFEECLFGGLVNAMIRTFGGYFLLTASTFHCVPAVLGSDAMGAPLPEAQGVNGIDIFLDDPGREGGIPIAPGAFYARSVESQSHAFLHTFRPAALVDTPTRGRDVVLEAIYTGLAGKPLPLLQVIQWSGPGLHGANLVLIGCRVRGSASTNLADGLVAIDKRVASTARVFDLGTADTANGDALVEVATDGERTLITAATSPPPWLLRVRATG